MTNQKMRPLPTVSKDQILRVLETTIRAKAPSLAPVEASLLAEEVFEALGLEVATCHTVVSKLELQSLRVGRDSDALRERSRSLNIAGLVDFLQREGPVMEETTLELSGDIAHRHSLWVIKPRYEFEDV